MIHHPPTTTALLHTMWYKHTTTTLYLFARTFRTTTACRRLVPLPAPPASQPKPPPHGSSTARHQQTPNQHHQTSTTPAPDGQTTTQHLPSSYLRALMLRIHPDLFTAHHSGPTAPVPPTTTTDSIKSESTETTDEPLQSTEPLQKDTTPHVDVLIPYFEDMQSDDAVQPTNIYTEASGNRQFKFVKRCIPLEEIRASNEQHLGVLNHLIDVLEQSATEKNVQVPSKTKLMFYCQKTGSLIRQLNCTFQVGPLYQRDVTEVVGESIEKMIYSLLRQAGIELEERIVEQWKKHWKQNGRQHMSDDVKPEQAPSGLLRTNWQGITSQRKMDEMFLDNFKDNPDSVLPPTGSQYLRDSVLMKYDDDVYLSYRPRYRLLATMADSNLIEFDERLTYLQREQAMQRLRRCIIDHAKKLQVAKWIGIGICFVPADSLNSALHIGDAETNQYYNMAFMDDLYPPSIQQHNELWDFEARPGWWLVPHDFTLEQLEAFTSEFLELFRPNLEDDQMLLSEDSDDHMNAQSDIDAHHEDIIHSKSEQQS